MVNIFQESNHRMESWVSSQLWNIQARWIGSVTENNLKIYVNGMQFIMSQGGRDSSFTSIIVTLNICNEDYRSSTSS